MSGRDVPDADMPNIAGSPRADVPELPDGALDALLTGDLVTGEAGAGLRPAAALLAALTAAPHDDELAGHARVLAEFRRRGLPVRARRPARRRRRSLTSLTARAAAAAAVAATALGGVAAAAYTGALPAPAQQFAHGSGVGAGLAVARAALQDFLPGVGEADDGAAHGQAFEDEFMQFRHADGFRKKVPGLAQPSLRSPVLNRRALST